MDNLKLSATNKEHFGMTLPAFCSFFVQLGDQLKGRLKVSQSFVTC